MKLAGHDMRRRTLSLYGVILLTGLAIGYAVPRLLRFIETHHQQGNYSAYFPDKTVRAIVYGTSDCNFCRETRKYLDEKGIRYIFRDVQISSDAASQHARLGGGGVPAVLIADRRIQGFWPEEIDKALARQTTSYQLN